MLTATATYTDAQAPEDQTQTAVSASVAVAADTRNKAPEFPDQDDETEGTQNTEAERTIAENSDAPTPLGGGAVTATDPNPNTADELTYTLGGPDASSFDISSLTGTEWQITVGAGTELDYETKQTYMVTVIATDSFGESASIDVTIMVTDVNEGPEITRGGLAISGPMFNIGDYPEDVAEYGTAWQSYMASGGLMATGTATRWSPGGRRRRETSPSVPGGVLSFRNAT